MRVSTLFSLPLVLALVLCLGACASPKQPPLPIGDLKIGVAPFTHPMETGDLFAGYMTENSPEIDEKVKGELDLLFDQVLAKETKRDFLPSRSASACMQQLEDLFTGRQAALRKWSALGRCMGVDLLVVPQIIEWRERDGGEFGVAVPARVVMDIFILDVNTESLVSRSRYDETQSALTSNLLETRTFIRRGGRWVQAIDLAREGMEKAIRELGL